MSLLNSLTDAFRVDKKLLKKFEKTSMNINNLSEEYSNLSDEQLKNKTLEFKDRLFKGETLDDILVEAFATAREASKRVIGEYPYLVQLQGGLAIHNGDVAEMVTGSGKTLTAVAPVYLNALSGKGVHVITVNEYLAERDANWMGEIYRFLGLTVGLNLRSKTPNQKREAYACDITYTTNSELGFDYLRDNMVLNINNRVLRGLNFAVIDECDSILIDESRTPLIISSGVRQNANLYANADAFVKRLKSNEDYNIDIKDKVVTLSESGISKAERKFKVDNLYTPENVELLHRINQALKANYIMHLDVDYVVENGEVIIVDPNTGRKMPGREWSDGLHQAVSAKENVKIKQETVTSATITYQNFFRLYEKVAGMTGTAKTEEEEFLEVYNMRVIEIPTNEPIARIDYPDVVFFDKKHKYEAIIKDVMERHEKGQPVLLGTISVETSELLSKYLKSRHIKHEVLNAKNHAREAEIIAKAGQKGAVTIATNMAGRGTDIKIDDEVKTLGGLAVIGSERHESRRIDNQLRGRSGRQGDPGCSKFYVAMDDELMLRFGSDKTRNILDRFSEEAKSSPISVPIISKSIESAQKRIEGFNYDVRKTLLRYDSVLSEHREIVYENRNHILEQNDVHYLIQEDFKSVIDRYVDSCEKVQRKDELTEESIDRIIKHFNLVDSFKKILPTVSVKNVKTIIFDEIWTIFEDKFSKVDPEEFKTIQKMLILQTYDRAWAEHIEIMNKLKNGIHLRSYAQLDPYQEYSSEGYDIFMNMLEEIQNKIVYWCNNVVVRATPEKVIRG